MKKGNIIVIICAILIIIVGIVMISFKKQNPIKTNKAYDDAINKIINRIDNKESFNIFLYSDVDSDSEEYNILGVLDYYSNVFGLDYEKVEMNFDSEPFKKLLSKFEVEITKSDDQAYIVIENGIVTKTVNGLFSEKVLKRALLDSKKIDSKYKHIDYYIDDEEFNKYYSTNTLYNVLYISNGDENLFKYREILAKSNSKSLVIYTGILDAIKTTYMFNDQLGIEDDSLEKFPILIKIKNKEIVSTKTNITLEDLSKEISKN